MLQPGLTLVARLTDLAASSMMIPSLSSCIKSSPPGRNSSTKYSLPPVWKAYFRSTMKGCWKQTHRLVWQLYQLTKKKKFTKRQMSQLAYNRCSKPKWQNIQWSWLTYNILSEAMKQEMICRKFKFRVNNYYKTNLGIHLAGKLMEGMHTNIWYMCMTWQWPKAITKRKRWRRHLTIRCIDWLSNLQSNRYSHCFLQNLLLEIFWPKFETVLNSQNSKKTWSQHIQTREQKKSLTLTASRMFLSARVCAASFWFLAMVAWKWYEVKNNSQDGWIKTEQPTQEWNRKETRDQWCKTKSTTLTQTEKDHALCSSHH